MGSTRDDADRAESKPFLSGGVGSYKRQQGVDGAGAASLVTGVPGFSGTDFYWDSLEEP